MITDKIQSWLTDEIVEVARENASDGFNEHNAIREAEILVQKLVKKLNIPNVSISTLFDDKGMCLNDKDSYFDEEEDLINYFLISKEFTKYPANSDIVKMHFASEYADETHGNYTGRILFFRAYLR